MAHYKLALLTHSEIHTIFHVSCLKKVMGQNCSVETKLLELDEEGSIWPHLVVVLVTQERHLHHHTIQEVFI